MTIEKKDASLISVEIMGSDHRVAGGLLTPAVEIRSQVRDSANLSTQTPLHQNLEALALNGGRFQFESLSNTDVTPQTIRDLSDMFRFTFNNSFPEYAICQGCDQRQPAWSVFGLPEGTEVPLVVLDQLTQLPCCPGCAEPMELFHDPQATETKLAKKFQNPGLISLIRDHETQQIEAFTFGYEASLREIFEQEWRDPYAYSRVPKPTLQRDENKFFAAMEPLLQGFPEEASLDMKAFCWNCCVVSPRMRSTGVLLQLIPNFFSSLSLEQVGRLPVVGETITDVKSKPYRILLRGGFQPVAGFLPEGYVLLGSALKQVAERFSLPPEEFKKQ